MTLAEACERLGWGSSRQAQDRLYARLVRAQRRRKCCLVQSGGHGTPVRVSWKHVAEVTRQTRSTERISAEEWDDAMLELDTRIAAISDRRAKFQIEAMVMPEFRRLRQENAERDNRIFSLMKRVKAIAEAVQGSDSSDATREY